MDLPTVELVRDAWYWIKPAYGDKADLWTVAKWEVGSFWGVDGREVTPSIISGPIPQPELPAIVPDTQTDVGSSKLTKEN